jgi:hypothetical protein
MTATATETRVHYEVETAPAESVVMVNQATAVVSDPDRYQMAGLPFAVSRRQLYYWTPAWQAEEAAALDELARGEGCEFKTMSDALRWLCDPDTD